MSDQKAAELRRAIGLPHATAMVVGTIIGASIFVQPSEITGRVPSVGGVFLVWLISGILTFFGALVCAELASIFTRTGGVYVYLKEAYSPSVGFLWGWAMFWSVHSGIIAAISVIFARYVSYFLPMSDVSSKAVSIACIVILSAINYVGDLGFRGVMVYSNINGVALSDERFRPLYEKADQLEAVFYIHPSFPVGVEAMTSYWLMPLIGFTFDTTLAAAKLVFSGVVERFPRIRWVLAHLGGAIPYLAERLDRGYRAFEECRVEISRPPSEYLKEFYYDTVNFDVNALQLAVDFAGTDHLLAGSDYPHLIGSLKEMVESIDKLGISADEKAGIYGGNASRLLKL